MYNVLLVEDDKDIQGLNESLLKRNGYGVILAMNIAQARAIIKSNPPDIVVLDIILPDGSGLDFLHELRSPNSPDTNVPVLLLTALGESSDVVRGLKTGGDDYLSKPYDNSVFLARLQSLLRRTERVPKNLVKGALTLDIISGRAFTESNDLLLTQKEFAVLLLLFQNEDTVISAQNIYQNVWKRPQHGDKRTLESTISSLRKKIANSGFSITASRGNGYIFEKI